MSKRIITFGTFDCLHPGHLNILRKAKNIGNYLIVGVSSDSLNQQKNKQSILTHDERMKVIESIQCVDEVFLEESLELKNEYVKKYAADILVMGDDWKGKFDWCDCETMYLPRTMGISTTIIKKRIFAMKNEKNVNDDTITLDCWLHNFTYVIPKIETLNRFAKLQFKFVIGLDRAAELQNRMLRYLGSKSIDTGNVKYITMHDAQCSENKNLGMFKFSDKKTLFLGHGYDEEECLSKLAINGYEGDFHWDKDFLLFYSFIADRERDLKIFNEIYQIVPGKKTIVFSDNGLVPFLQNYKESYQVNISNQILDILISLKTEYNVVLRFHPMKENGYNNHHQFQSKITENFVVDFTPFNIFFIYTVADIMIGSRITSSALCSLFSNVKKIIFIDNNYDKLNINNYTKNITNTKVRKWMNDGLLLSEKHLPIIGDWELDKLSSIIANDEFYLNDDILEDFFARRYGIIRSDIKKSINDLLSYTLGDPNVFDLHGYIKSQILK